MAYYRRTNVEKVSEAIAELRYTEMLELCSSLSEMGFGSGDFLGGEFNNDPITPDAFADLLSGWSQAIENAVNEATAEVEKKNG